MTILIDKIDNNKLFKFIRDNFSLIIFIPSILGGLKQLIVLLSYSPTLIQYFSFSQLAIDGLETIIQGIYIFLIVSIIYYLIAGSPKRVMNFSLINITVLILYVVYIFYTGNYNKSTSYNLTTLDSYLFKFTSITFLAITIGNDLSRRSLGLGSKKNIRILENLLTISSVFLAIYFIVTYKPFQYNVKNVVEATEKVKLHHSKNAELIYYNDTYLIFSLNPAEDFNDRKFYVQKFETLFEEDKK